MLQLVLTLVYIVSGVHGFLGLLSVVVGVISSIKAEVWLAHSVSPIWSGGFFIITGIVGVLCAKRKSSYVIMCYTAFSVVSMVVAVVNIQLLRLGLVNHTTEGYSFQKEKKDILIIVALGTAGTECLVCLISTVLSCRVAKIAKEEMCKQREGMFHVKDDADRTDFSNVSCDNDDGTYIADGGDITIDIHGENNAQMNLDTQYEIGAFRSDIYITDAEFNGIVCEGIENCTNIPEEINCDITEPAG